MKAIAIANNKGGVGKSSTAIIFADELMRRNKKVLFIDTDPQCNSTKYYRAKMNDVETLGDILCGDFPAESCIQHCEYGDIIPSDDALKDAENLVKPDEMRFYHLKESCKGLENLYDYIIIDTPPSIGVILKNAIAFADEVLIPISEDGWSLEGLMNFYSAIEMAQRTTNQNLKISGLLITMHRTNTNQSGRIEDLANDLAIKMHTKVFKSKIRFSVRVREALTEFGIPLNEYAKYNNADLDYTSFVDEYLKGE